MNTYIYKITGGYEIRVFASNEEEANRDVESGYYTILKNNECNPLLEDTPIDLLDVEHLTVIK
jgi:hypothetical protein